MLQVLQSLVCLSDQALMDGVKDGTKTRQVVITKHYTAGGTVIKTEIIKTISVSPVKNHHHGDRYCQENQCKSC